jgi:hypothetical protein
MVPIAPLVAAAKSPPNPTAGARHAKKRNNVAARHCGFNPSLISDPKSGNLAL